tara:strand:+ start:352 stop:501 length:150 start_codon:yes stop_codon:yes gene_type:complete
MAQKYQSHGGRVELIATDHGALKEWISGINLLVSNKKELSRIANTLQYM